MENERRVQQKAPASRYALLDELRGLDLVSMMLYHACWDMMFLSGFCLPLGHRPLRRGLIISGAGVLVTAVTLLFMPEDRVVFGVLTLLGAAMLITGLLQPLLQKIPAWAGLVVSLLLFAATYHTQDGFWQLGPWQMLLPGVWYANLFTAFFGFFPRGFFSTDYFPLLPWLFLFWAGYFLHFCMGRARMEPLRRSVCPAQRLDGPALAFAVSAAPAGDLRRTFSRGSSFCIKGLTQPGSCGILSVVRRY